MSGSLWKHTAQAVINEGNRLFILYDVSVHDPIYKRV